MTLRVLAPVAGTVVAMSDVPDPVFAGSIVGPGIAVDPDGEGEVHVVAPVDGTVVKLHPHAFVLVTAEGRGVLVHLGLDTVQLGGVGFTLHAQEGDVVSAGDVVVSWDPAAVEAGGRSPICPVVALDGKPGCLTHLVDIGAAIRSGEPLFEWT